MRKKLTIVICLLVFVFNTIMAQSYTYIYYLNDNLEPTDSAKAIFIGKGIPDNDLFRVDYFNLSGGKPFLSIHFSDPSLGNMTGSFKSYYRNGNGENEGLFKNNIEEGVWIKWDSSGHKMDSSVYQNGKKVIRAYYFYAESGKISSYVFYDSISQKNHSIVYNDTGGISYETDAKGENGVLKIYEGPNTKEIPFSKDDFTEASFSGGDQEYRKYLQKNLDANTPVEHGAGSGTYRIIIRFLVNIDGSITDVAAETQYGFGMETESIRIIKRSPKWQPAKIAGYPVVAYRRQPITFVVQEN